MDSFVTKYDVYKTMYQKLEASVNARGNRACLYYYNNTINWNQLMTMVDRCAAALVANGVRKGDRVIVCAANMPQTICAIYAINKIGAIASLLDPLAPAGDVKQAKELLGAKYAFCFDVSEKAFSNMPDMTVVKCKTSEYFPRSLSGALASRAYNKKVKDEIEAALNVKRVVDFSDFLNEGREYLKTNTVETQADYMSAAITLMSDGKAAVLSSYAINSFAFQIEDHVQSVLKDAVDPHSECMLSAMPICKGFGLGMCMHYAVIKGMPQALFYQFDAKACSDAVPKYKISFVFGDAPFFDAIHNSGYLKCNLSKLKFIGLGDELADASLRESMNKIAKDYGARVHFSSGYGFAECVSTCAMTNPLKPARDNCLGNACYNVETCVVKPGTTDEADGEGELCISAPTLMLGYWNDEQASAKVLQKHSDGRTWLHTGRICRIDNSNGEIIFS